MEKEKSIYADVRASAISWRVRDMYNLYGTIRRVLFEGRKAERAAMLSELIKMQGVSERKSQRTTGRSKRWTTA